MFDSLQRYVYDRRRGLLDTTISMGTAYAVNAYVRERWDDTRQRVGRERAARESLRRRFQLMHNDACFAVMALIPTLATQILEEMDVESLTNELQTLSLSSGAHSTSPQPPRAQYPRSESEISVSDAQSEAGSVSLSSYSGSVYDGERVSVSGSGSWVRHMSETSGAPSGIFISLQGQLSDSVTSTSSSLSSDGQDPLSTADSASLIKKRKAQLWKEVKDLTLSRVLTTLYTTTLLSLLTITQIALLTRSRYVASVRASERAERAADRAPQLSLTGILAREAVARVIDIEAVCPKWLTDEDDIKAEDTIEELSEATESRYLTLSWWILHVGWKDVAARVRSAVESVFDRVPLRTTLSCSDLRALILDVRRHIELEGAKERTHSRFFSSLLPPTPEMTAHVLAQGGTIPVLSSETYQDRHSTSRQDRSELSSLSGSVMVQDGPSPITAIDTTSPKSGAVDLLSSLQGQENPPRIPPPLTPPPHSHANSPRHSLRAEPSEVSALLGSLGSDPQFMALLAETRAYLSGPNFAYALTCALDRATDVLMDGLGARVFADSGAALNPSEGGTKGRRSQGDRQETSQGGDAEAPKEVLKIKLVRLLPGLARWSQLALNATPNELVDNIVGVREVSALEAIIMSDYQDRYPPVV